MSETNEGIGVVKHGDGTVTIIFPEPWRPNAGIFLCFLFDGVGIGYIKRRGKVYITSITCSPDQWKQYLFEWGRMAKKPIQKIQEVQAKFDEFMEKIKDERE